jgi:hypothetical protein
VFNPPQQNLIPQYFISLRENLNFIFLLGRVISNDNEKEPVGLGKFFNLRK